MNIEMCINPKVSSAKCIYKVLAYEAVGPCITKLRVVPLEVLSPEEVLSNYDMSVDDTRVCTVWIQHTVPFDPIEDVSLLERKLLSGNFSIVHGGAAVLCEAYANESIS